MEETGRSLGDHRVCPDCLGGAAGAVEAQKRASLKSSTWLGLRDTWVTPGKGVGTEWRVWLGRVWVLLCSQFQEGDTAFFGQQAEQSGSWDVVEGCKGGRNSLRWPWARSAMPEQPHGHRVCCQPQPWANSASFPKRS